MRFGKIVLLTAIVGLVSISSAEAGTITCPVPDVGRDFTLTTTPGTATCHLYGDGNINGQTVGQDAILALGEGWIALDKDPGAEIYGGESWLTMANGATTGTGTFTVFAGAWAVYDQLVLGLKTGNNGSPTWASFLLEKPLIPGTNTTGSWIIQNPANNLSHLVLYGRNSEQCVTCSSVPEPATLLLFGTGLAALAVKLRRRKA